MDSEPRRKRRAQNDTEAPIDSMKPIRGAEFLRHRIIPCPKDKFPARAKKIPYSAGEMGCNELEMLRELTPGGAEMVGNLKKFPAKFPAGRELTEIERSTPH